MNDHLDISYFFSLKRISFSEKEDKSIDMPKLHFCFTQISLKDANQRMSAFLDSNCLLHPYVKSSSSSSSSLQKTIVKCQLILSTFFRSTSFSSSSMSSTLTFNTGNSFLSSGKRDIRKKVSASCSTP